VSDVRPERAHGEGHHVHRATAHRAPEQVLEDLPHLVRIAPVVRRPRVLLPLGADEGPILDPGDVAGVGAGEVGVRPLGVGKLVEGAVIDQVLAEAVVLLGRAIAPMDGARLGQLGEPLDPGDELLVLGQRCRGRRRLAHWMDQLLSLICKRKRPGRNLDVGTILSQPEALVAESPSGRVPAPNRRRHDPA
jgi:hypothetical protein